MNIGDLVLYSKTEVGIIEHIFINGDLCVLFEDGVHHVESEDCEVIND